MMRLLCYKSKTFRHYLTISVKLVNHYLKLTPEFTLRKNQRDAVAAILKHDFGILHAPTAFGKMVTAIAMIVKRKVNTLILVHSRQLLEQWQERLRTFLTRSNHWQYRRR